MEDQKTTCFKQAPIHCNIRQLKCDTTIHLNSIDKKGRTDEILINFCHYVDIHYSEYILPIMEFRKDYIQVLK